MFSNKGIAQAIPKALNELGYEVDIMRYNDLQSKPSGKYDLFVGHMGLNFEQISRQLPPETIRIYFSTSLYWRECNVREAGRIYDLAVRRGYVLPPDRTILQSEDYANCVADGIICLGNQDATGTYSQFPCVIGINNAAYPVTWHGWKDKDYEQGRRHFLFFSGGGSIHKGLDLLLEAFAGTELHLHVCQHIGARFGEVYRHELTECPNIHMHGYIPMRSVSFEALALQCNWVISATCGEGQPGAVIECMAHGLVPVLPAAANIDLGHLGILLPDCTIDTIRRVTLDGALMSPTECCERSLATHKLTGDIYTPERFTEGFKSAVSAIVERASTRSRPDGRRYPA